MFKQLKYIFVAIITTITIISGCDAAEEEEVRKESIIAVAVGNNNTIITSYNGTYWTERTVPTDPGGAVHLKAVAYGNGLWLAGGGDGTDAIALKSTDGINWETINVDTLNLIQYNGTNPTAIPTTKQINAISYYEKPPHNTLPATPFWVIVGDKDNTSGFIIKSNDLENISFLDEIASNTSFSILNDVANDGDNNWVAVGDSGTVLTSANSADWAKVDVSSSTTEKLNSVDYGKYNSSDAWIAVGGNNTNQSSDTTIIINEQGTTWTSLFPQPSFYTSNPSDLQEIAYRSNGIWGVIGVRTSMNGKSGALYNYNGTNWQHQDSIGDGWYGIDYNYRNDTWVAVGISNNEGYIRIYDKNFGRGATYTGAKQLNDVAFKE